MLDSITDPVGEVYGADVLNERGNRENANADSYKVQTGSIYVSINVGNYDDWGSKFRCDFSYEDYRGETHSLGSHTWWWDCNYEDCDCDTCEHNGSGGHG